MGSKIFARVGGTPEGTGREINGRIMVENDGKNVLTKRDEEALEKIALATGGSYIRATNRSIGLTEIIEDIDKTQKKEFTAQIFDEFNEQYQYFLAAAILLLLANTLMLSRKNSIFARFNIFRRDGKL